MITNYYFSSQLRRYIIAFANIFTGLQVQTGNARNGSTQVEVPVRYGSTDRVLASLGASNTQNKQVNLPVMSCYMTGIDLAPDRIHGLNQVDRRTYLEQGGVFPDDVKGIKRVMPIPYNLQMELSIYASNSHQFHQIIEQILMLFDYDMQLQFSDAVFDWTKISKLTLTSITNEENYPMSIDRRAIIWTLTFELPVWISPPYEVRNDVINTIKMRIGDIDSLTLNEFDQEGNLVPFTDVLAETTIEITDPDVIANLPPQEDPMPDFGGEGPE